MTSQGPSDPCGGATYLSSFDILADERVVRHRKLRRVVVDVQHFDEDGHSGGLAWIIWSGRDENSLEAAPEQNVPHASFAKEPLLISVATTEMLCHLDISLSRAFSVVMVPLVESMLNSLSRSVCRSIEYLKG